MVFAFGAKYSGAAGLTPGSAQGSLLIVLWGPYVVAGVKLGCKASSLLGILDPVPPDSGISNQYL